MNTLQPERSSQEITLSRRIGFLVFPDCEILDVGGPFEAFHFANHWLQRFGRTNEPSYQLRILAATPGPIRTMSGFEIVATHSYSDTTDGLDTLIVAGGIGVEQACKDAALVEWVRSIAPRVRRVASICTGAFILAAAGLLDRRRVTTHWMYSELLARAYPSVQVDSSSPFRSRREYLLFGRDHRGDRSGLSLSGRRPGPRNHARCRPHYGGFSPTPRRAIPVQRVFEWFGTEEPARHR